MPVPKRKRSRARRDSRHAHRALTLEQPSNCKNCTAPLRSHQACANCGYYKGVRVITPKHERTRKRMEKKAERDRAQTPVEADQSVQSE